MRTRTWVLLFAALALVCAGLSLWLFRGSAGDRAEVYSEGKLVLTVDLTKDGSYTVEKGESWNELTVRDGRLCVSAASCPSQDCVHAAPANSGAPIVCLPNRLVIRFANSTDLDAISG